MVGRHRAEALAFVAREAFGMIRLADVAQATGYSIFTVSCALRGVGKVAPATRAVIVEAAERLGYRPNGPAALLARQRTRTVADAHTIPVAYPGRDDARRLAFEQRCAELGLKATPVDLAQLEGIPDPAKVLWNQGFEALYLPSHCLERMNAMPFDWARFCVVKETRLFPELRFHLIRLSAFDYLMETLQQVYDRGYRRIAVLLVPTDCRRDDLARVGAIEAFRREEAEPGTEIVYRFFDEPAPFHRAHCSDALSWIQGFGPDAIIAFPMLWYIPLVEAGFRIPEDFGLAACITVDWDVAPAVSGCISKGQEMGQRAANRLARLLQLGERGMTTDPIEDVLEPSWSEGETLPAVVPGFQTAK